MTARKTVLCCLVLAFLATAAISPAYLNSKSQSAAPIPAAATKIVAIEDPVYRMTAYSLTIPDSWIFQGVVVQGTSCVSAPLPVFRMSAPDGLTGVKWFPRTDWAWSGDPKAPVNSSSSDCLPYKHEISASDFLKGMIGVLKVEYVKDLPTPNLAAIQKNVAAQNTSLITSTADAANFQVRYHIHQIEIEDHLNAVVICSADKTIAAAIKHNCSVSLSRSWAPLGKWSEETFSFTKNSLKMDEKWNERLYVHAHPTPGEIERGRPPILDEERTREDRARMIALRQSHTLHEKQYQDFLGSMRRDADISIIPDSQTAPAAVSSTRMPDDWCDDAIDHSLAQRRIPEASLLEPADDPLAFNYTWINEKGDRIQTKNLNGNPNGNGTGHWTLQGSAAQN